MAQMRDAERASLREKTKNMNRREKAEYIWEYYKVYFIVGLVLLVAGSTMLWDMHKSNLEKGYVHVGVVQTCAAGTQMHLDLLARQKGWDEPLVYRPFASASDPTGDGVVQITASMSTQEMDIIICDSNSLYFLMEAGVSPQTDLVVPLLGSQLEKNIGAEDLCLVVLSGQERSEKAMAFAEYLLEQVDTQTK